MKFIYRWVCEEIGGKIGWESIRDWEISTLRSWSLRGIYQGLKGIENFVMIYVSWNARWEVIYAYFTLGLVEKMDGKYVCLDVKILLGFKT